MARISLILLLMFSLWLIAGRASAVTYAVLGDSISSTNQTDPAVVAWPELLDPLYGPFSNQAIGGWGTYDFLFLCGTPDPCWADVGDSDTTWFFLIGHNDTRRHEPYGLPPTTPESYAERLQELADLVQQRSGATDFRLISSPYSRDRNWDGTFYNRSEQRAWQDDMAVMDQLLCATDWRFTCAIDLRPLIQDPAHYLFDGVHQNQSGQNVMALYVADHIETVPEPSVGVLMGSGLLILGILRKNRRKCSGPGLTYR